MLRLAAPEQIAYASNTARINNETKRLTVRDLVREAAKIMDTEWPGWHAKINLETFDIDDGQSCVLGQATEGFGVGVSYLHQKYGNNLIWAAFESSPGTEELEFEFDSMVRRDFNSELTGSSDFVIDRLNEYWIEEIDSRLEFTNDN